MFISEQHISDSETWIKCYEGEDLVGYIKFILYKDGYRRSASTYVMPDSRGKGIATQMYLYAHSLGYKIRPSTLQSEEGRLMWNKFRKERQPFYNEGPLDKAKRIFFQLMDAFV